MFPAHKLPQEGASLPQGSASAVRTPMKCLSGSSSRAAAGLGRIERVRGQSQAQIVTETRLSVAIIPEPRSGHSQPASRARRYAKSSDSVRTQLSASAWAVSASRASPTYGKDQAVSVPISIAIFPYSKRTVVPPCHVFEARWRPRS